MNVDQNITAYLTEMDEVLRQLLAGDFVGSYLHGSLAIAAFQPGKSDIDLLVTVTDSLHLDRIGELQRAIRGLPLPAETVGLDLGVLVADTARHVAEDAEWAAMFRVFRAPSGQETRASQGFDPLLFVEIELLRLYGIALTGPGVAESFGPVDPPLILRSCAENCRVWASRDVFHDPASGVLNVCRAWRYLAEGTLVSKPAAGEWAKSRSEDSSLIEAALATRRGDPGHPLDNEDVKAFCQRVSSLFYERRL